jgi:hypothetical protein
MLGNVLFSFFDRARETIEHPDIKKVPKAQPTDFRKSRRLIELLFIAGIS